MERLTVEQSALASSHYDLAASIAGVISARFYWLDADEILSDAAAALVEAAAVAGKADNFTAFARAVVLNRCRDSVRRQIAHGERFQQVEAIPDRIDTGATPEESATIGDLVDFLLANVPRGGGITVDTLSQGRKFARSTAARRLAMARKLVSEIEQAYVLN